MRLASRRFVVKNGFGAFDKDPAKIARTVSSWVQDPAKLDAMASAARAAAAPTATQEIAADLLAMLDDPGPDKPSERNGA